MIKPAVNRATNWVAGIQSAPPHWFLTDPAVSTCSEHLPSMQSPLSLSECNTGIIGYLLTLDSILSCQQVLNIPCKSSICVKQSLVKVLVRL